MMKPELHELYQLSRTVISNWGQEVRSQLNSGEIYFGCEANEGANPESARVFSVTGEFYVVKRKDEDDYGIGVSINAQWISHRYEPSQSFYSFQNSDIFFGIDMFRSSGQILAEIEETVVSIENFDSETASELISKLKSFLDQNRILAIRALEMYLEL